MYTDPSCRQYAIIGRVQAERTGAIISVSGKTVQIIRPDFTLSITAASITETDGIIRADNIQSILVVSAPFETDTKDVGRVTSSFTADIVSWPSDAWLTVTFDDPVNPVVADTFQRAVTHEGGEIAAIAYTLTIQKTNMISTACSCSCSLGVYTLAVQKTDSTAIHSATITMSAPAEWVDAHGGINAIVIGRIGDDQKGTILKTSFSGYDQNGNMEFIAESPEGLSVFALIATRTPLQNRGTTNSIFNPVGGFGFAILILLIIMLVIGYLIWRKRRSQRKDITPIAKKVRVS